MSSLIIGGCSPDYVNNKPTSSTADLIPTTYAETAQQINKICTSVITSSNSIDQKMTRYLEQTVNITTDDKNSIVNDINTSIQETKRQKEYANAFRPAEALRSRITQVNQSLDDFDSTLRALRQSVEDNNYNGMVENLQRYRNIIGTLQGLSVGM